MAPVTSARPAKPDPLEYVLVLSAFAAGSVDIISFARLGHIFASAMTGNLALLAFYVSAGSLVAAFGSLIALIGFVLGAAAGTLLVRDRQARNAIIALLGSESLLLLAAVAVWFGVHRGRLATDGLTLILSISMGLQSICGKKINLSSIPTIVFTSTLTNIVIALTGSLMRRTSVPPDTRRQAMSFSLYFLGAFCAGILCFLGFGIVILLPLAAIAMAMFAFTNRHSAP